MFTGIIETLGHITDVITLDDLIQYKLETTFLKDLRLGESISHNGICLTISEINEHNYSVQLVSQTLKTAAAQWKIGDKINLERAMPATGRFDGHIVTGHVDTKGIISELQVESNLIEIAISFDPLFAPNIIPKGSICVQGVSLTVASLAAEKFTVAIIPHTWEVTNLKNLHLGAEVNLEFDIIGKYAIRYFDKINA